MKKILVFLTSFLWASSALATTYYCADPGGSWAPTSSAIVCNSVGQGACVSFTNVQASWGSGGTITGISGSAKYYCADNQTWYTVFLIGADGTGNGSGSFNVYWSNQVTGVPSGCQGVGDGHGGINPFSASIAISGPGCGLAQIDPSNYNGYNGPYEQTAGNAAGGACFKPSTETITKKQWCSGSCDASQSGNDYLYEYQVTLKDPSTGPTSYNYGGRVLTLSNGASTPSAYCPAIFPNGYFYSNPPLTPQYIDDTGSNKYFDFLGWPGAHLQFDAAIALNSYFGITRMLTVGIGAESCEASYTETVKLDCPASVGSSTNTPVTIETNPNSSTINGNAALLTNSVTVSRNGSDAPTTNAGYSGLRTLLAFAVAGILVDEALTNSMYQDFE